MESQVNPKNNKAPHRRAPHRKMKIDQPKGPCQIGQAATTVEPLSAIRPLSFNHTPSARYPRSSSINKSPHPLEFTRTSNLFSFDSQHGITVNIPLNVLNSTPRSQSITVAHLTPVRESHSTDTSSTDGLNVDSPEKGSKKMQTRRSSDGDFAACHAPRRFSDTIQSFFVTHQRRASVESVVSDLTRLDHEVFTTPRPCILKDTTFVQSKASMFRQEETHPNNPHPALEFPPLYFLIRWSPVLLDFCQSLYRCRWHMSYPLQRRVIFSKMLRKAGVFLTWGEVLLILPLFAVIITGNFFSFVNPSVSISGHAARIPLIFCFVTAMRNSFLTLLLGIPFERTLWYHKLSARLAYVNGILHTYVAFVHPNLVQGAEIGSPSTKGGNDFNFGKFLVVDQVNSGGTMLIVFMTLMMITAMPWIRHRFFELFYYCHVVFAASMVTCAFFHTGKLVPILVASTWGLDLFIRKVQMACFRNPRIANIRIISESVVELCIPKSDFFDYNPGQYVYLAVPELSIFEWHPFSLSSSPGQRIITMHIRKSGHWTSALYALAEKKTQVNVLMEGPFGSVGVDLMSDRYKMVMLFSGGIGVTPMQAICNHLMYEQSTMRRELKKLTFIWVERDPVVMQGVDVVRCSKSAHFNSTSYRHDHPVEEIGDGSFSTLSAWDEDKVQGLASTLLAMIPASGVTDEQFEQQYPSEEFADLDDRCESDSESMGNSSILSRLKFRRAPSQKSTVQNIQGQPLDSNTVKMQDVVCGEVTKYSELKVRVEPSPYDIDIDEETLIREAYKVGSTDGQESNDGCNALDLQVYLTGKSAPMNLAQLPFVHFNRPDVKKLFSDMREDAIAKGETRIAVCVCAPARLVQICRKACAKYSDQKIQFDFHEEVFD